SINTCIIVVEKNVNGETILVGALADSVQEVLEIEPDQIEAAPRMGVGARSDFIMGMGKRGEEFLMILDLDKVFCFGDTSGNHCDPAR
ncbi:chemotaxis protein CheW, partial [bacterium]